MDFQIVVLAGGLDPLVSKELPKALLPVANRPVISYVLELLEQNDLKNVIVVVEGESTALLISNWISSTFIDRLDVEVIAVPEDVGTAGALRAIGHRLTANDILVVSGDLITEIRPGVVAARHRRHDAIVTAMLCPVHFSRPSSDSDVSGPSSDSGSSGAEDKSKKAGRYTIVGLDQTKQFLLHIATGAEVEKDIRVQKSILRAVGQMEIRSDLMDMHMYAFKRSVLLDVLKQKETFRSLRRDVLPYLVRSQLRSEISLNGAGTHKCCVYIADKSKYCVRLNSIQAFSDLNRDIVEDANHLPGYTFSAHNNVVDSSGVLGSKTTVEQSVFLVI